MRPEDAQPSPTVHVCPNDDAEARKIRARFAEMLDRGTDAIVDKMRDDEGHVVLNADDLFKQWPEYAEHPERRRTLGPLLYEPAARFTDALFKRLLSQKASPDSTVVFTAGGGSSGKSTVLRAKSRRPDVDFVVDTTFSRLQRAMSQVEAALAAGRKVEIRYVYRDFRKAVRGMIERGLSADNGRVVPVDTLAETHYGAQDAIFTAIERYEDDPRVRIELSEYEEGTLRALSLEQLLARVHPEIDVLKQLGQDVLDEAGREIRQIQRQDLPFDRAFYEAARSKTAGSRCDPFEHDGRGAEDGGADGRGAERAPA